MKYRQTYTIFHGFGSRWCDGFDRRSPTAELLNKVNISILISNYQKQAPVLINISFCNKIITGTIMIERFVTVAILIFFLDQLMIICPDFLVAIHAYFVGTDKSVRHLLLFVSTCSSFTVN